MLRAEDGTLKRLAWVVPALAASVLACEAEETGADCGPGKEKCECYPNHTCDSGLICSGSGICVDDSEDEGSGGSGSGGDGGSGGSSDAGGSGGTSDAGGSGGSGDAGGSSTGDSTGSGGSSASGGSASGGTANGGSGNNATGGATSTDSGGAASTNGGAGGTAGSTGSTSTASGGVAGSTTTSGGSGGTTGETRTAITPLDGWVDASTNDVGIQGAWYTFSDGVSTIVPASDPFFEGAGSQICVSGGSPPHENEDLSWGAAVAMDLNSVDAVSNAYNAPAYGVVGIKFSITGDLPPRLQVSIPTLDDSNFCRRYESIAGTETTLSVYFNELELDCWEIGVDNPTPDPALLRSFQIVAISSADETISWDFCVENVSAIVE